MEASGPAAATFARVRGPTGSLAASSDSRHAHEPAERNQPRSSQLVPHARTAKSLGPKPSAKTGTPRPLSFAAMRCPSSWACDECQDGEDDDEERAHGGLERGVSGHQGSVVTGAQRASLGRARRPRRPARLGIPGVTGGPARACTATSASPQDASVRRKTDRRTSRVLPSSRCSRARGARPPEHRFGRVAGADRGAACGA